MFRTRMKIGQLAQNPRDTIGGQVGKDDDEETAEKTSGGFISC